MNDLLLDEFRFEPDVYELGKYSPVSIRDQIVRASYLVDRLWRTQRLNRGSALVVIGAGAAGVSAAVRARAFSIKEVHLVEAKPNVMPLQAGNDGRTVDPVQYDWPAAYWNTMKWPLPEPLPRAFTAVTIPAPVDLERQTADRWASSFNSLLSGPFTVSPKIEFHSKMKALPWSRRRRVGTRFSVPLVPATGNGTRLDLDADVIILANGLGDEDTKVEFFSATSNTKFTGIRFWTKDNFQNTDLGIPDLENGVLVSGAGDGALQDYVRLVTGLDTCAEVLETVVGALQKEPFRSSWLAEMGGLWHWEDHAQRATRLITQPKEFCDVQSRLHARYEEVVENLVNLEDWQAVVRALEDKIMAKGRRPIDKVFLAYKCNHFTWCYGLNRLVALIVIAYVMHHFDGLDPRQPFSALTATDDQSHPCQGDHGCWGKMHHVMIARHVKCTDGRDELKNWPVFDFKEEDYEGLVIRHGIDAVDFFDVKRKLRPQQMPFHLP